MGASAKAREASLTEYISSMNEHSEELAAAGEWEAVAELVIKRNAMLREVDDAGKEAVLRETIRSTDRVRAMVDKAKTDTGRELGQIQRGQEAARSYGSHV